MRVRGIASGALALVALQVVVSSNQTGRIAQLLALPAAWARRLIDPTVPGIPARGSTSTSPTSLTT
jgi:hypothetical protein